MPRTFKQFMTAGAHGVAWLVVIFGIAALAFGVVVPRIGGATPYTVLTGSMKPHYPPGTLIVSKPIDTGDLKIGDVVTYQLESGKPEVVTHRIVGMGFTVAGDPQFITQGDNNSIADAKPVQPQQIRGKLWYAIPLLGRVSVAIHSNTRELMVYVIAGALALFAAWQIFASGHDKKEKARVEREAAEAAQAAEAAAASQPRGRHSLMESAVSVVRHSTPEYSI
ncbi:MAG: signal peptidase I [Cellulomonadaceae bacterium]|jgi:signal peptidase|nr:signal peptidase I [Cellulomonadaceae bacterium]